MTEHEIVVDAALRVFALEGMAQILAGKPIGRPRHPVSTYLLPVTAIRLLDSGHAAMSMPRSLRPVAKSILGATKRKKGPKLPSWLRKRNLEHGKYAPETVRRYQWLARKEAAKEKLRQAHAPTSVELEAYRKSMPKPGTPAFSILAVMAARHWLE